MSASLIVCFSVAAYLMVGLVVVGFIFEKYNVVAERLELFAGGSLIAVFWPAILCLLAGTWLGKERKNTP